MKQIQSKELERLGKKGVQQLTDEEHENLRQLLINQKLMGMGLNSGGHLTHGYRLNISSKLMKVVHYEVDPKTEKLDYEAIRAQAKAERPTILLAGYSAYPRKINFKIMKEIADEVDATFMVDMAHFSGLVAGNAFRGEFNPVPYADVITSTTHKTLRGPRGGFILCKEPFTEWINKGCPIASGGPMPHVMAAKTIAFQEANSDSFKKYAQNVLENAKQLATSLTELGVRLVTGGTENHLIVADVTSFNLTGKQAESALAAAHITLNRNTIPLDTNGPWFTSGIRLGTPAMTTLGMGPAQMKTIAELLVMILSKTRKEPGPKGPSKSLFYTEPETVIHVQGKVSELLNEFPLYPELSLD